MKTKKISKQVDEMYHYYFPENWGKIKIGDKHVDFDKAWNDIEVPTLRRIKEPKMSLANKITLVLTIVNVAILISLVIKNV